MSFVPEEYRYRVEQDQLELRFAWLPTYVYNENTHIHQWVWLHYFRKRCVGVKLYASVSKSIWKHYI